MKGYKHTMDILFSVVFGSVILTEGSYVIDDSEGYGRRFDGIGAISGGGATSKLLVNYPPKLRDQILDFLFKVCLIFMLGLYSSWDENYGRGYEWWLMGEAKKRNPHIKLYGLPWAWPGWVGDAGSEDPWVDPDRPAQYVLKWIQGAKSVHNLTIDYIGIWNEKKYSDTYIKLLRRTLDINGFSKVKIVAADKKWRIADDILKDPDLSSAVETIGCHYPGTQSDPAAEKTGKALWASEDYSTFNDNVGAGCWARILNMNYVNGNMTATIAWNLIASYYRDLPYVRDGLMTAMEPWSGHYQVDSPIWMTAHTTQLTEVGWRYLRHGAGVGNLAGGGSYVTLVSPDGQDLTIVIETMSHDHSKCIRPPLKPYNVKPQNITFTLKNTFAAITTLNVWYSRLFTGEKEATTFFVQKPPIKVIDSQIHLTVNVDEVYTLTTLTRGYKGDYPASPKSLPFPAKYQDDFEGYAEHEEPYNLSPQTGSFEVVETGPPHKKVVRQMVLQPPIHWCGAEADSNRSISIIGSHKWQDVMVQGDIRVGDVNGSSGYFIAGRVDRGGCHVDQAQGIFLYLFPNDNIVILANDFQRRKGIHGGTLFNVNKGWNNIFLYLQGGYAVFAFNNVLMFNVSIPSHPANGFVALGTDSWGIVDFDNLRIDSQPSRSTFEQ